MIAETNFAETNPHASATETVLSHAPRAASSIVEDLVNTLVQAVISALCKQINTFLKQIFKDLVKAVTSSHEIPAALANSVPASSPAFSVLQAPAVAPGRVVHVYPVAHTGCVHAD